MLSLQGDCRLPQVNWRPLWLALLPPRKLPCHALPSTKHIDSLEAIITFGGTERWRAKGPKTRQPWVTCRKSPSPEGRHHLWRPFRAGSFFRCTQGVAGLACLRTFGARFRRTRKSAAARAERRAVITNASTCLYLRRRGRCRSRRDLVRSRNRPRAHHRSEPAKNLRGRPLRTVLPDAQSSPGICCLRCSPRGRRCSRQKRAH